MHKRIFFTGNGKTGKKIGAKLYKYISVEAEHVAVYTDGVLILIVQNVQIQWQPHFYKVYVVRYVYLPHRVIFYSALYQK